MLSLGVGTGSRTRLVAVGAGGELSAEADAEGTDAAAGVAICSVKRLPAAKTAKSFSLLSGGGASSIKLRREVSTALLAFG